MHKSPTGSSTETMAARALPGSRAAAGCPQCLRHGLHTKREHPAPRNGSQGAHRPALVAGQPSRCFTPSAHAAAPPDRLQPDAASQQTARSPQDTRTAPPRPVTARERRRRPAITTCCRRGSLAGPLHAERMIQATPSSPLTPARPRPGPALTARSSTAPGWVPGDSWSPLRPSDPSHCSTGSHGRDRTVGLLILRRIRPIAARGWMWPDERSSWANHRLVVAWWGLRPANVGSPSGSPEPASRADRHGAADRGRTGDRYRAGSPITGMEATMAPSF